MKPEHCHKLISTQQGELSNSWQDRPLVIQISTIFGGMTKSFFWHHRRGDRMKNHIINGAPVVPAASSCACPTMEISCCFFAAHLTNILARDTAGQSVCCRPIDAVFGQFSSAAIIPQIAPAAPNPSPFLLLPSNWLGLWWLTRIFRQMDTVILRKSLDVYANDAIWKLWAIAMHVIYFERGRSKVHKEQYSDTVILYVKVPTRRVLLLYSSQILICLAPPWYHTRYLAKYTCYKILLRLTWVVM